MAVVVFGDLLRITDDELIELFTKQGKAELKQKREKSAIIFMSSIKDATLAQQNLNDTIQYGVHINVSAELIGFLKELKPDILKECFNIGMFDFEVGRFHGDAVLENRCVCNKNLESVFNKLQIYNNLLTEEEQNKLNNNDSQKKADLIKCLIGTLYQKSNRGIKQQQPEELLCNYALVRLLDEIYNLGLIRLQDTEPQQIQQMNIMLVTQHFVIDDQNKPQYQHLNLSELQDYQQQQIPNPEVENIIDPQINFNVRDEQDTDNNIIEMKTNKQFNCCSIL